MDQPELSHHVSFHVPEEEHDLLHMKPSAISLRTPNTGTSSHPNVPHLLLTQDQAHPSLSRIVSGFFHVEDALRPSTASCGNLEVLINEIISL
nr:Hypothetical protein CBG14350 [Haemonchus contortus]